MKNHYTGYLASTMIAHAELTDSEVRQMIKKSVIRFAGNAKLKIFGRLQCESGKRMNKVNRLFFRSQEEAQTRNFRPCAHCLKKEYQRWKNELV